MCLDEKSLQLWPQCALVDEAAARLDAGPDGLARVERRVAVDGHVLDGAMSELREAVARPRRE